MAKKKTTKKAVAPRKPKKVVAKKTRKKKKNAAHYVDNEEFFVAMVAWKKLVLEAEAAGEQKPGATEYIGTCFLEIATHLSYRPNFIGYSYREEMISDGIENCLMYASNFDPAKSSNPFSYFTQIVYYAFVRRIQKEKKQQYIKWRCFEAAHHKSSFVNFLKQQELVDRDSTSAVADYLKLTANDIANFEAKIKPKRRKKKKSTNGGTLEGAFDEAKDK